MLLQQDIIFVGGGNTANLLAVWRLHGVDQALRQAWEAGIVLCGISAGMNCWFESSVTDSFGPLRELRDGLGFLRGSACPHFDGEAQRRPVYHRLIREQRLPAGVAADDGAAIHYVNGEIRRCVASRPHARAYRVSLNNGQIPGGAATHTFLIARRQDSSGLCRTSVTRHARIVSSFLLKANQGCVIQTAS